MNRPLRKAPLSAAPERLLDLLADRALVGLDASEQAELAALLAAHPEVDADALGLAAAAADLALSGAEPPAALPAGLRGELIFAANAVAGTTGSGAIASGATGSGATGGLSASASTKNVPSPADKPPVAPELPSSAGSRGLRLLLWCGWAAAAAGWAFAVLPWLSRPPADPARDRMRLLAEAADVKTIPWADPVNKTATGDVVWSQSRQQGYIRFRGLKPNDPAREQYQLWIIDAGRKAGTPPVDGGVFDVRPGADEVVIPIRAPIKVHKADWFAVTVEAPGGVVVSDQSRIAAVAKPG